jgi:hypothetical protein
LALLLLAGCATTDTISRVERGPLLRSSERQSVVEGGATSDVRVEGSLLKLTVAGYDVCRSQTVEEFTEETINEGQSRTFGPALSTGMVGTVAGGVLLLTSFFVSPTPNLDSAGNKGLSTRQTLQIIGGISLGVGIPALVVAIINKLQGDAPNKTRKVEEIADQHDTRCNERPVNGKLELFAADGASVPFHVEDGAVDIDSSKMPLVPETMRFEGRNIELSPEGRELFSSWSSQVLRRLNPADAPPERAPRAEIELPHLKSFEAAVEKYSPSTDLSLLANPEANQGRAILVQGIVGSGHAENIGTIQIGEREVFMFIPSDRTWEGPFAAGTRVEAVALIAGTQTLGDKTLPLLRAVWMRNAW